MAPRPAQAQTGNIIDQLAKLLEDARQYAVFVANPDGTERQFSMNNSDLWGNLAIGANVDDNISGGSRLNGDCYEDDSYILGGSDTNGCDAIDPGDRYYGQDFQVDLDPVAADIAAAIALIRGYPDTQTISGDLTAGTTLNATAANGINKIYVTGKAESGITLNGAPTDYFLIEVAGQYVGKNRTTLTGGIRPSNVIWVFGGRLQNSGGNGWLGTAMFDLPGANNAADNLDMYGGALYVLNGKLTLVSGARFRWEPFTGFDYGDAPDPSYPTLYDNADGGAARHKLVADGPKLGSVVDAETDGQPTAQADGDDNGDIDDEDGIPTPISFDKGTAATVNVTVDNTQTADSTAYLSCWLDLNGNDAFEAGEKQTATVAAGVSQVVNLNFGTVPTSAPANTSLRCRVSHYQAGVQDPVTAFPTILDPPPGTDVESCNDSPPTPGFECGEPSYLETDPWPDGEVEDYPVTTQTDGIALCEASVGSDDLDLKLAATFGILGLEGAGNENGDGIIEESTCVVGDIGFSAGTIMSGQKLGEDGSCTSSLSLFSGATDDWEGAAIVHSVFTSQSFDPNLVPGDGFCYASPYTGAPVCDVAATGLDTPAEADAKLDRANEDALAAAAALDNLFSSNPGNIVNLGVLVDDESRTVTSNDELTLVDITSIDFKDDYIELIGRSGQDDAFIIRVTGDMSWSSSQVRLQDVRPERVLWYFPGDVHQDLNTTVYTPRAFINKAFIEGSPPGTGTGTLWKGTILAPYDYVDYHNPAWFEGAIVARQFRVHSDQNLSHSPLDLSCPKPEDFGDAPDTYSTLLASNGPRHEVVAGGPYLGPNAPDDEADGQPINQDDTAGIDDEDGIATLPRIVTTDATVTLDVDVNVSGTSYLACWIDFDLSGTFDPDEREEVTVTSSGTASLVFTNPGDAQAGDSWIRCRISTSEASVVPPDGDAPDGEVEDTPVEIVPPQDFGDAPDTYGTLLASDGARHGVVAGGPFMGANAPDSEDDGQPLDQDDVAGIDDEDGFTAPTIITTDATVTLDVDVDVSGTSYLACWIDFDQSGTFDADERQEVTVTADGTESLVFTTPNDIQAGDSWIRCRISTDQNDVANPTGSAADGEVEDLPVTIENGRDYGDAPDTYGTLLASNGPRHVETAGGPYMGATAPDVEADGQPIDQDDNVGNDDEDGIATLPTIITTDTQVSLDVDVNVSGTSYLACWIDFDRSGTFDADERQEVTVTSSGTETLTYTVPGDVQAGDSWIRCRISTDQASIANPTGLAPDGEVEDTPVEILPPQDYGDAPDTYKTLLANDGPRHVETAGGPYMGANAPDTEDDGQPVNQDDAVGGGDIDDEDGIPTLPAIVVNDTQVTLDVDVNVSGTSYLACWIDFDLSGTFDADERQEVTVTSSGTETLTYTVPGDIQAGDSWIRCRISTDQSAVANPFGSAPDGEVEDTPVVIEPLQDYGDAPDTYGTLLASNGARHEVIAGGPFMGANAGDTEDDGQPINQDDAVGTDDEDGFTAPTIVVDDTQVSLDVDVNVTGTSYLACWIDFDRNGTFDADERQEVTVTSSGTETLTYTVPGDVQDGDSWIRCRISSDQTDVASPTGPADDGEVEDLPVVIEPLKDFGDAPDTYGTLLASDGARHGVVTGGPFMGANAPDTEDDGQPVDQDDAVGTDDEDGLTAPTIVTTDATVTLNVDVDVSATSYLACWIDFDLSGTFDADERQEVTVTADGTESLVFTNPGDTQAGNSWIRCRISTDQASVADPTGLAPDGEVEDTPVVIELPSCTDDGTLPSWDGLFCATSTTVDPGANCNTNLDGDGTAYVVWQAPTGFSQFELLGGSSNINITDVKASDGSALPGWSCTSNVCNDDGTDAIGVPTTLVVYIQAPQQQTSFFFFEATDDCAPERSVQVDPQIQLHAGAVSNPVVPIPDAYGLDQNYPNPFRSETHIVFSLPESSPVTLTVYDLTGRKVRTLAARQYGAGRHEITWDGRGEQGTPRPNGIYIYRLEIDGVYSESRRLTLIR